MAKLFEALDDNLIALIEAQPMFFIASAFGPPTGWGEA